MFIVIFGVLLGLNVSYAHPFLDIHLKRLIEHHNCYNLVLGAVNRPMPRETIFLGNRVDHPYTTRLNLFDHLTPLKENYRGESVESWGYVTKTYRNSLFVVQDRISIRLMQRWLKKAQIDETQLRIIEPVTGSVPNIIRDGSPDNLLKEDYPYIEGVPLAKLLPYMENSQTERLNEHLGNLYKKLVENPLTPADLRSKRMVVQDPTEGVMVGDFFEKQHLMVPSFQRMDNPVFPPTWKIEDNNLGFKTYKFSVTSSNKLIVFGSAASPIFWTEKNIIVDRTGRINIFNIY